MLDTRPCAQPQKLLSPLEHLDISCGRHRLAGHVEISPQSTVCMNCIHNHRPLLQSVVVQAEAVEVPSL